MDENTTRQLVSLLASSIQDFCHGQLKFSSSVEVVGHIHLNIDRSIKLDYVLSEEVNKITNGSSFQSHSYLSKPPDSVSEPGGLICPSDKDSHQDNTSDSDLSKNCQPVSRGEMKKHQMTSLSQNNGQSASVYTQNNKQVSHENIQPATVERSTEKRSQSVVSSQLVHQTTETQIPETPQPTVIGHKLQDSQSAGSGLSVQKNHPMNVQSESSPSVNIIERQPPGVDYSQTNCQSNCQSTVDQSVQGVSDNIFQEGASSSDSHHSLAPASLPQNQMNSGDLGIIEVKQEECINQPSDVTFPFSSSREMEEDMEIPELVEVVIENVGSELDGTQLMNMREGIEQDSHQSFPYPIMLHSHSVMSAHNSSRPETPASIMPSTPPAVSLADSITSLQPNSSSNTGLEKTLMEDVVELKTMVGDVGKNMRHLSRMVWQLVDQKQPGEQGVRLPDEVKLPLTSVEEVDALEAKLDDDLCEIMILNLSSIKGNHLRDLVKRIMTALMTDKCARHYNWKGNNDMKHPFCKLKLMPIVMRSIKQSAGTTAIPDAAIEGKIKQWLRFAPERDGGRKERERKKKEQLDN